MITYTAQELIEIIKALSALLTPILTAYVIIKARSASNNLKSVLTDVARLEKNTNSISERNEAIANKLGITEGIAQERAAVQATKDATENLTKEK